MLFRSRVTDCARAAPQSRGSLGHRSRARTTGARSRRGILSANVMPIARCDGGRATGRVGKWRVRRGNQASGQGALPMPREVTATLRRMRSRREKKAGGKTSGKGEEGESSFDVRGGQPPALCGIRCAPRTVGPTHHPKMSRHQDRLLQGGPDVTKIAATTEPVNHSVA